MYWYLHLVILNKSLDTDDPEHRPKREMAMDELSRPIHSSVVGEVRRSSLGFPAFFPFWPVRKFHPGINVDTKGRLHPSLSHDETSHHPLSNRFSLSDWLIF